MNHKIFYAAFFAAGVVAGAWAAYCRTKAKYEQILISEINDVKEHYAKSRTPVSDNRKEPMPADISQPVEKSGTAVDEAQHILHQSGYDGTAVPRDTEHPYVISPDEFGELDNYETISLTYYSDNVLTDDCDCVIDDIDTIVGRDSLTRFGEYETDAVFVRSDSRKTDYEILRDYRRYADVLMQKPYLAEDQ